MRYKIYNATKDINYDIQIDDIINLIRDNSNDTFYKFINNVKLPICNDIVINTQFICHRINTSQELETIPEMFGTEIDIRDNNGELSLSHDPFINGENLDEYVRLYNHNTLILNIKSERTEIQCIEIMKKYKISNYFFLDSSFPMIYLLNSKYSNNNIACRLSEYEPIEYYNHIRHMVSWVWVDCFSKQPLTPFVYSHFQKDNTKICIVSPELQNHSINTIYEYRDIFIQARIIPDAICCKLKNIIYWI